MEEVDLFTDYVSYCHDMRTVLKYKKHFVNKSYILHLECYESRLEPLKQSLFLYTWSSPRFCAVCVRAFAVGYGHLLPEALSVQFFS